MLLCVVYRQPNANYPFWDKFQQSVENATNYSSNVVITGDLNVDFLSEHSHKLFDIMRLNDLKNMITEPTRTCNTRQSLLDPVLVSDNCNVLESYVIQVDRKFSDHKATIVYLKVPLKSINTYKRLVWDYRNADFETCNDCISSLNWNSIISPENSMDENCQTFTKTFIEIIKNCVPQKEVTIRLKDKVWFNFELRREIRKRDRLRKLARRSNSDSNINKYKKQRNHVNNLKKHAKEQFYFNVNTILDDFSSSNSKSYWSLIKKLVKSSGDMSPISQLKKENNDLISDDYEKACLLNNYFCSISTLNNSNTS